MGAAESPQAVKSSQVKSSQVKQVKSSHLFLGGPFSAARGIYYSFFFSASGRASNRPREAWRLGASNYRARGLAMAVWKDWSAEQERVLQQAQAGFESSHKTNIVYIDLAIAGQTEQPMRLAFQLFEQNPLSFANFHALISQSHPGLGEAGHLLRYKGSAIYRISRGQCIEGGDITLDDGRGGDSIYGAQGFEPEAFGLSLRHDCAGLLSMVPHAGSAKCQSRFRICFGPMKAYDGEAVVIGRLVSGAMHLSRLESLPVDVNDRPVKRVTLVECGLIPGWSQIPAPLPSTATAAVATLTDVSARADELRDSVASAVHAALAGDGTSGGASKQETAGNAAEASKKRPAPSSSGGSSTAVKRSALMALPFEGEMSSDDEDDEDEDGRGGGE